MYTIVGTIFVFNRPKRNLMKKNVLFSGFLLLSFAMPQVISAQKVDDEACVEPKKKVMKIIEEAKAPKTEKLDRFKLFREAIDKAPDNAVPYYEFAKYLLYLAETSPSPAEQSTSYSAAQKNLLKIIEICEDYHSDVYYYLGVNYYAEGKSADAVKYFKKFMEFDSKDAKKYARDYDKKIQDVKSIMPEIKFYDEFYNKPVPFDPTIVAGVSSTKDEYFPMISPDNELIFYTRKLDRRNLGDIVGNVVEELTLSQRPDVNNPFDEGKPLKEPFNDPRFNNFGGVSLSIDNKEMIICACKTEEVMGQQYNNCDLYVTKYKRTGEGGNDFEWTPLENLGEGVNTNSGWEGQPTLSANGKELYFAANRPSTRSTDILVSKRNEDGTWGKAVPIGGGINSDKQDKSPFLHQDSETLYFVSECSDTRWGAGKFDIFYTQKDENGGWKEPKNIGYPINSEHDEVGLFVSTDGKLAYFASNRMRQANGGWDIYAFELYEQARPKDVMLIKGELKNDKGEPVQNAKIQLTYAETKKVEEIEVNNDDGTYAAIIDAEEEQDVLVTVKKENHAFDSKLVSTKDKDKTYVKGADLAVEEIEVGKPYTINDILYATASADLNKKSKFILQNFALFLKENPGVKIMIQGHTDNEGNDQLNLELSERRAKSVKAFLIEQGIAASRLEAKGFGETKPKVPNTSDANKALNRRTDFVITDM